MQPVGPYTVHNLLIAICANAPVFTTYRPKSASCSRRALRCKYGGRAEKFVLGSFATTMMMFAAASRTFRPVLMRPLVGARLASRAFASEAAAPTERYNKEPDADGKYTVTLFSGDGM